MQFLKELTELKDIGFELVFGYFLFVDAALSMFPVILVFLFANLAVENL